MWTLCKFLLSFVVSRATKSIIALGFRPLFWLACCINCVSADSLFALSILPLSFFAKSSKGSSPWDSGDFDARIFLVLSPDRLKSASAVDKALPAWESELSSLCNLLSSKLIRSELSSPWLLTEIRLKSNFLAESIPSLS